MNIIEFTILVIVIIAGMFLLGFIGHLIYLIFTPSYKLSREDFGKKNILCKLLKLKK
jgi:hypothetical protein